MRHSVCALAITISTLGCEASDRSPTPDLGASAERFFTGVYGCHSELVDELAADSVVISYPVFQTLLGKAAIHGREAVKQFADRFCSRWSDPRITVHETLRDGSRVVLVWGFQAVPTFIDTSDVGEPQFRSWGGISFFQFDEAGKVLAEIGEESSPGPMARIRR